MLMGDEKQSQEKQSQPKEEQDQGMSKQRLQYRQNPGEEVLGLLEGSVAGTQ